MMRDPVCIRDTHRRSRARFCGTLKQIVAHCQQTNPQIRPQVVLLDVADVAVEGGIDRESERVSVCDGVDSEVWPPPNRSDMSRRQLNIKQLGARGVLLRLEPHQQYCSGRLAAPAEPGNQPLSE